MRVSRLAPGFFSAIVLLLAPAATAQSVWTIPGIVNAGGLNNTRFVSDFTATNPGTAAAQVTIDFFPSSTPNPKSVTLSPGQTIVYGNIVDSLFGTSGAGALSISSDQPLLLRARTYNTASSGTYGVALPVYENDRLLTSGDIGDSLWVTQDASGSSGYRTNVAVVFPDEAGGAATVTVFDADGNEIGQKDFTLDTAGFQQFSVGSFAGAVSVGRAQIHVTRGRAASYSVVVDNITGDSSLFTFEDLPGGRQDVLLNGVARANGRNATFFRTDGRFYNPTDTDATIEVMFHASGNANPSPASASFTLGAGKLRSVVDVLDSLLGLPVGSAGALRFKSDWPVAILCRTSNVDPSGGKPGTFGAQQKPVPLLSFLTSADAGASITGIRQGAAFRTNVGFAAGGEGAQYTLTLTTAAGATVATTTASLGAFGWTQPGIQDLFPAVTIPQDATLRVKVTAGSLDAFDSSIDNLSGDPVVTPIAPLPADIPMSATIGPAGGSIRSDDGRLTLKVPAGALASSVTVTIATNPVNGAPQGTGSAYRVSPQGLKFGKPASLVFRYDGSDVDGSASGALGLAASSGGQWFVQTGGVVDPAARTLIVPIASISPPPSARSSPSRAVRVDSWDDWAPFVSFRILPKRAAVLPDTRTNLVVLTTGQPSSRSRSVGSFVLGPPASPGDLTYQWAWYGTNAGDLQPFGPSAIYTAPHCPPPSNPVLVTVTIVKPDRRDDTITLQSRIRIVAREWVLTATLEAATSCNGGGEVSDYVKYLGGFSFSVDNSLNVVAVVPNAPVHSFRGNPQSCDPTYETNFRRKAVSDLIIGVNGGNYDVDVDRMGLNLNLSVPGPLGYDYNYNDGRNTPGQIPSVPPIQVPEYPAKLPEGRIVSVVANGPVALILVWELKPVGCH